MIYINKYAFIYTYNCTNSKNDNMRVLNNDKEKLIMQVINRK